MEELKMAKKKVVSLVVAVGLVTGLGASAYYTDLFGATPEVKEQAKDVASNAKESHTTLQKVKHSEYDNQAIPEPSLKELKDITNMKGEKEIDQKVKKYLSKISFSTANGVVFKTLTTQSKKALNGHYVFGGSVRAITPDSVIFDAGIEVVEVEKSNLKLYSNFDKKKASPKLDSKALLVFRYIDGKVVDADVVQLDTTLESVQHAVLDSGAYVETFSNKKEQLKVESESYERTTMGAWSSMAKTTAKQIQKSNMAPVFLMPHTNIIQHRGDLEGNYYYIIAGILQNSSKGYTSLKSYEGKNISLDFGDDKFSKHRNQVVWMHVITKKGKVQNIEVQEFPGANLKTMVSGITDYTKKVISKDAK